jgi:hypothetical protein
VTAEVRVIDAAFSAVTPIGLIAVSQVSWWPGSVVAELTAGPFPKPAVGTCTSCVISVMADPRRPHGSWQHVREVLGDQTELSMIAATDPPVSVVGRTMNRDGPWGRAGTAIGAAIVHDRDSSPLGAMTL